MLRIAGLILLFFVQVSLSYAHPYKLDAEGCHNNSKLNVYECHEGQFAGKSWPNPGGKDAMLKEKAPIPPQVPVVLIQSGTQGTYVTWQPVVGAATYQLAFYTWDERDGQITQVEIDRISFIVESPITTVLLGCTLRGADHYFRVRSVDANGQVGPWSATIHYTWSDTIH